MKNATNATYKQGEIAKMTIFSYEYDGDANLGGQTAREVGNTAASAQITDYNKRELNSNTMQSMNRSNFKDNATISLYGCNIGGYSKSGVSSSFGQTLTDYMGGNRTVNAFTGGGGAEFTQSNGRNVYGGRMIRAADRASQQTLFTTFKVSYKFRHYDVAKMAGSFLSLVILLYSFYRYIDLLICTKWIITIEQIIIKKGVFFKTINYIELYRVYDYEEKKSFIQALVGNTNISIHSGDKSHPVLDMRGLKEDNNIIPIIRERVENQRETKQIYEFTNR